LTQVVPFAQTFPHAPQLLLSVAVLTQTLLHRVWPVGHSFPPPPVQTPFTQVAPAAQRLPHDPQLMGSVFRSVHWPLQ